MEPVCRQIIGRTLCYTACPGQPTGFWVDDFPQDVPRKAAVEHFWPWAPVGGMAGALMDDLEQPTALVTSPKRSSADNPRFALLFPGVGVRLCGAEEAFVSRHRDVVEPLFFASPFVQVGETAVPGSGG